MSPRMSVKSSPVNTAFTTNYASKAFSPCMSPHEYLGDPIEQSLWHRLNKQMAFPLYKSSCVFSDMPSY